MSEATWVKRSVRVVVSVVTILIGLLVLWELYKIVGERTPLLDFCKGKFCPRSDDRSMPHIWTIFQTFVAPAQRGADESLAFLLLQASWFTWREALAGFVVGTIGGFFLAILFSRSTFIERGLMPYVVGSQTVPLLAIAPMVVIWSGRAGLPSIVPVAAIAAYLTFFPVTINTLRGLRSPEATASELMRSYAASPHQTLWKLQVPAALPYLFTALKIAAAASVVGAIVAELPTGIQYGLGRILLTFSQYFITGPQRLFASVLGSALLGIVFVALVSVAERLLLPPKRRVTG